MATNSGNAMMADVNGKTSEMNAAISGADATASVGEGGGAKKFALFIPRGAGRKGRHGKKRRDIHVVWHDALHHDGHLIGV